MFVLKVASQAYTYTHTHKRIIFDVNISHSYIFMAILTMFWRYRTLAFSRGGYCLNIFDTSTDTSIRKTILVPTDLILILCKKKRNRLRKCHPPRVNFFLEPGTKRMDCRYQAQFQLWVASIEYRYPALAFSQANIIMLTG